MATQPQPLDAGKGAVAAATNAPSAEPPQGAVGGGTAGAVGATVWNNNKTVNALWSINEDRNSWMGIVGTGWVKLSTASDTGVVALTALAADAYQTQRIISYRQESDGMAHEIYAW